MVSINAKKMRVLVACTLVIHSQTMAQDTGMKKPIAPKAFYATALQDDEQYAAFSSVATWLAEGSVVLVDLRSPDEYAASHIKGAKNIPATELTDETLAKVIPFKTSRVVLYCSNNFQLSRKVALTTMAYPVFKQLGYLNTLVLASSFSNDIAPLVLEGLQHP